jgi:hypothetical protein
LAAEPQAELSSITIAGSRERVRDWLGLDNPEEKPQDLHVVFESPSGTPGILEVTFETPKGTVTL